MASTSNPTPNDDNSQDDSLIKIDVDVTMSPQFKKFLETSTEAGKVIIKVGKIIIPILLTLSMAAQHFVPKLNRPDMSPTSPIEAPKEQRQ